MKKGQIWTIVGVAFVVAVIVSISTVSITGDAIRIRGISKPYYTKAEVDTKLSVLSDKMFSTMQAVNILIDETNTPLSEELTAVINPFGRLGEERQRQLRSYAYCRAFAENFDADLPPVDCVKILNISN